MVLNDRYFRVTISGFLILFGLLLSIPSHASQNGRNGFSGNPSTNGGVTCQVCHASGAMAPAVSISGATVVDAGTTNAYTVTITGGPAVTGGVNISVNDFAGLLEPSDLELHRIQNELSHTTPKGFSGNEVTFSFLWTAPEYNTDVTLYAAGNSSNNQLDLLGDGINAHSLAVTVQNGTPPPPPDPPTSVGSIELEEYVTGLNSPVVVAHAGDQRLFIVDRAGLIRLIDENDNLLPSPFLDITNRVSAGTGNGEKGLLGLAFHPNYAANGYFYVYYTRDPGPGLDRSRVSRFQVSADPSIVDENSELVIMEFEQPFSNHNGGDVHFGPDGYLYIASGDGGSGGDPQNFAQNSSVLLGKLLRMDVDGAPGANDGPDCDISGNANFRIPPSNAFNDGIGGQGCDEIYATGLRNPWRFSFDRQTGDLWIADVGQGVSEEINFVTSGAAGGLNFGWRCYEGNNIFNSSGCTGQYFFPLHEFSHSDGNCSVTGGFVYRGSQYPNLDGLYFFTDFCNTAIRSLSGTSNDPVVSQVLPSNVINTPSTFGEDLDGELYIASLSDGVLYKIREQPPAIPTPSPLVASVLPASRSVQVGTTATAFGLLINGATTSATSCSIAPRTSIPATFSYQTTDPGTNALTGSPNTPVDIPAGASQTFLLSLTPTAPITPREVALNFECTNTASASSTVGLNTLLLSASTTPVPDIVALVAVPTNDGIIHLPGGIGSTGVFVVASLNVGATGTMTVSADTGNAGLPLNITLCQTDPDTGVCLAPPSTSVTTSIVANATPTFGVFVTSTGPVPFDPANSRIFVRFRDGGSVTRGSTSVAAKDGP